MGWLRDLMETAEPPLRSFGKLSSAALKATDWPPDSHLQPRSLATLLSRLDRGQDLTWLADRRAAQLALAQVLGVSLDEIRRASGAGAPRAADGRLLRWTDLPGARPLDLSTESLPPGIPAAVLGPFESALWWFAPSGAGKGLVGHWLAARGRAAYFETRDAAEVDTLDGPLFVEFLAESGAPSPRARPGLCVAASTPPPADAGFRLLESPPLDEVLVPLLKWAIERLPHDTRLDPDSAQAVLAARIASGSVDSWGALLGMLGLIDELGLKEVSSKSPERLAQRFVEQRISRAIDPQAPFASWLRRSAHAALLGLAQRCLVDSDLPLCQARSFEAWLELVPPELERHVDLEWMRLSLSQVDSSIRSSDLERAARKLPPGAFRVVSSLEQARLLRRDAQDQLKLEPAWLRSVLQQSALGALLGSSPFEWGEALLRPHTAAELAEALLERALREGGSVLEPVLDLASPDQPSYAAAVDLAFRTAGIARLLGAELSQELLEGLWAENAALSLDLGGELPLPRLEFAPRHGVAGRATRRGELLLADGSFYLAALSISEMLHGAARSPLAFLDPWHQNTPDPRLGLAYDRIAKTLAAQPDWWRQAFALVSRARRSVGNVLGAEIPHELEVPAQILDEVVHGVLTFTTLSEVQSAWLEPLLALSDEQQTPRAEVARAIWNAWEQAGRPDGAPFLAPNAAQHGLFWSNIPGEILTALIVDARRHHVPYAHFGDEQWEAFARALARFPELVGEREAWEHVPAEWIGRLLALPLEWPAAPRSVEVLWRRFPDLLRSAVERQLAKTSSLDAASLGALLSGAPSDVGTELVGALGTRAHALGDAARSAVRALLRRLVNERGPNWRDAYQSLSKLEREWRSLE